MSFASAKDEIDRGESLRTKPLSTVLRQASPARRFSGFLFFKSTTELLDMLRSRGIVVFGADLWAATGCR